MIINLIEKKLISFKIWFNQVPFHPNEALYYVLIFYDKDGNEINEFCKINPSLCFDKIKDFLVLYHYKIQDLKFNKLLESQNIFGQILIDFQK